jgi:hypothetical protein
MSVRFRTDVHTPDVRAALRQHFGGDDEGAERRLWHELNPETDGVLPAGLRVRFKEVLGAAQSAPRRLR